MVVKGSLGLGGAHDLRGRGSLELTVSHGSLVTRSCPAVFGSDGVVMKGSVRRIGEASIGIGGVPKCLEDDVVEVYDGEAVWAGRMMHHFGHFLVESVARLWAVLPGSEVAGLPVVFGVLPRARFEQEWLDAFGVRVFELPASGAVRFGSMFVPETAWQIQAWISPEVRDIHLHARKGLDVRPAARREVIWLSRADLAQRRTAYDESLFEWLLSDRLAVLRPESMPLAEQVAAFESCRAVVGVIGSAFHTLLMTERTPDSLYLCPRWDKGVFPAQHWLLDADATFSPALVVEAKTRRAREGMLFPGGYRLLIPNALRALAASVVPDLFDDPKLARFGRLEGDGREAGGWRHGAPLDRAVAAVMCRPTSFKARLELGSMFEAEGLARCAVEQYVFVSDVGYGEMEASLRAARLFSRAGRAEEASTYARRVLEVEPSHPEALGYVI